MAKLDQCSYLTFLSFIAPLTAAADGLLESKAQSVHVINSFKKINGWRDLDFFLKTTSEFKPK